MSASPSASRAPSGIPPAAALCQGHGTAGRGPRAGLDEPDQLPPDAHGARGGAGPARGAALRRGHSPQRAGGLIPQEALVNAAIWYLQMDQFEPEQILEQRLYEVSRTSEPSGERQPDFLDQLASGQPTPGGGSAAAHTAAAAAALVAMVARTTIGKKKYAGVEARMWELIEQAEASAGRADPGRGGRLGRLRELDGGDAHAERYPRAAAETPGCHAGCHAARGACAADHSR
jgi:hypothetical protein